MKTLSFGPLLALALAVCLITSCKEAYRPTDFMPPAVQKALDDMERILPGGRYQLIVVNAADPFAGTVLRFFLLDTKTGKFHQGVGPGPSDAVFTEISWKEEAESAPFGPKP